MEKKKTRVYEIEERMLLDLLRSHIKWTNMVNVAFNNTKIIRDVESAEQILENFNIAYEEYNDYE